MKPTFIQRTLNKQQLWMILKMPSKFSVKSQNLLLNLHPESTNLNQQLSKLISVILTLNTRKKPKKLYHKPKRNQQSLLCMTEMYFYHSTTAKINSLNIEKLLEESLHVFYHLQIICWILNKHSCKICKTCNSTLWEWCKCNNNSWTNKEWDLWCKIKWEICSCHKINTWIENLTNKTEDLSIINK